jgi:hypothetical protein
MTSTAVLLRELDGEVGLAADLHVQARSVLAVDPNPRNAFDVTVALEVGGHNDADARALGSPDLFDLGQRVYTVLPLFEAAHDARRLPPQPPVWPGVRLLASGLLHSAPWVAALVALLIVHVSFWSTIITTQFSSAISLALYLALILTGAFVQAFARRGTFYLLQGNGPLLKWTALRFLAGAGALAVVCFGCGYLLLEHVLYVFTPAANRMFLFYGLAITALLLSLAPLYMTRALGWLAAAAVTGAAFLIVAGRMLTHGNYLDPYTAMNLGLAGIGVVVLIAVPAGAAALRHRTGREGAAAGKLLRVSPPRLSAVLRSVGAYAVYGAGFFSLLVADQLVAGGIWHGTYEYAGRYQATVALALVVLIPVLAYVVAVQELLPTVVRHTLACHSLQDVTSCRDELGRFYRRHLRVVLAGGAACAVLLAALFFRWLSGFSGTGSLVPGIRGEMWWLCLALASYVLLSVGAFNSGLLFAFARPWVPAVTTVVGALLSLAVGGVATALAGGAGAAVTGLAVGSAVFAAATTFACLRAFSRFDSVYYGAF